MMKRILQIVSIVSVAVLLSACLTTAKPTATPTVRLAAPAPSPAPGKTAPPVATPTVARTATRAPSGPALAIPAEFATVHSDALSQLQTAQPSLHLDRANDSAAAMQQLQAKKANWAISTGFQPTPASRLLCLTPFVPIVHFDSPLDDMSAERLRAIYQGQEWGGPVLYSGDPAAMRRILSLDNLGAQVAALPSWQAVVDRVAGDRTAIAFVPWSEVDARVKTLSLDGRSIAANGIQGYARGDAWWLTSGNNPSAATSDDIARLLACPIKEPLTFLAGGDMLLGWFVNDIYVKQYGPEYLFKRIADLTRAADIAFGNFENPMSNGGVMENKGLMFRASPDAVKGLSYAGIDVVNLANNHFGDYGQQAMLDTLDTLRRNGIGYAGAGKNRTEARSPWITTTKGIKIALLAYTDIEPSFFTAADSRAGTAWIEPDNMAAEIKKAKTQADFVIVSFHMGTEYTPIPTSHQQDIAKQAVAAGANLVIGHHPHVVQGVEFAGPVFIDYSIGDFVYSQPTRPATGEGVMLRAVIDSTSSGPKLRQVQMIPIYVDHAQPYVVSPVEAKLMMARIFDATRLYKGLPPSTEQAASAPGPVSLPQGQTGAPSGSLVFDSISGQQSDIVLVGSGGSLAKLTTSGTLNDAPALSPDGKRIAYSSAKDGTVDIYVANADGSGAVNVTRSPAWNDYPTWSPDGTKIAFNSNRDGPFKIYVMNADGSNVHKLSTGTDWDTTPAWSPDGQRIAFASDDIGTFQIYVMNADGSNTQRLTNYANFNGFPAWAPDSKQIAYQSYQDESAAQGDDSVQDRDFEIMVISAAGGAPRRLTNNTSADVHPAWSPDGKRIAFASDRSGTYQIYVMNADGSGAAAITNGAGAYLAPAWAP